jgi:hypothetical protein
MLLVVGIAAPLIEHSGKGLLTLIGVICLAALALLAVDWGGIWNWLRHGTPVALRCVGTCALVLLWLAPAYGITYLIWSDDNGAVKNSFHRCGAALWIGFLMLLIGSYFRSHPQVLRALAFLAVAGIAGLFSYLALSAHRDRPPQWEWSLPRLALSAAIGTALAGLCFGNWRTGCRTAGQIVGRLFRWRR